MTRVERVEPAQAAEYIKSLVLTQEERWAMDVKNTDLIDIMYPASII